MNNTPTSQDNAEINIPKVRLIIVGDEILSGRRQDKHLSKMIELLSERGMYLSRAEIITDGKQDIANTLKRSFATDDIVFCCGGIGATPDDQTRQAAALALGVELELHPQAKALISERCADMAAKGQGSADMSIPENQQRLQMGYFPKGSQIVPNEFNKIPGFFINNHTFMPGFPVMAWQMMEWVLDNKYKQYHHQIEYAEESFIVYGIPESRITPALEFIDANWQQVKSFSLPSAGDNTRPHIELGVKGNPNTVAKAIEYLKNQCVELDATFA